MGSLASPGSVNMSNGKSAKVPRYVSLDDAAAYLGVSVATVRRRIMRGDLKARRLGRQIIRVDLGDVEALLRDVPSTRVHG